MQWQTVYQTPYPHRAGIVQQILLERGIQSVILDKKDSMYGLWGEVEVQVHPMDVIRALKIVRYEISFEQSDEESL
jgi:hypothetical protein